MRDLEYFSKDDRQARERFLALSEELREARPDAEVSTFEVPSLRVKDLYLDQVYLPAQKQKKTLLILSSGVHGAEAYTGCAVQMMFLKELWAKVPQERTGCLIFHVLNPFGFRTGRRATESNVNLNRNFGADASLFKTANPGYKKLAPHFEKAEPVGSVRRGVWDALAFIVRQVTIGGFSPSSLNQAMAGGQFEHARGLEYGGATWEPQVRYFIDVLKEKITGYEEVLLFDLHTGLGERFELHLIPSTGKDSQHPELLKKYLNPDADRASYVYTPTTTKGFYETAGDLNNVLPSLLKPGQKALGITMEYGTVGNDLKAKIKTLAYLWLENRGFHHGYANSKVEREVKDLFQEQFFPSEPSWRENAIRRARKVLARVVENL